MNSVCGYKFEYDYQTNTPKHYLSIFLKYAVPKEFIWDEALKKMLDTDSHCNIQFGEKDQLQREIQFAGSTAEGLAIPDYLSKTGVGKADIDRLLIHSNTFYLELPYAHNEHSSGQILRIESAPHLPPNYAYLTPTDEFRRSRALKGQPVETEYFANRILKESTMIFNKMIAQSLHQTNRKPGGMQKMLGDMKLHGPAATLENPLAGDRDEVPVIFFPGWPPAARDWAVRVRASGWPTQKMIRRIVVGGFYMAGVGRRQVDMFEYEWRYSFNMAEKILAHSLSKSQRQVYIYLKLLRKFYLSEPAVFASYWLKIFFFWECEKLPESVFESHNLGDIMLYLLDEISHILVTGCLRHYFMPSINLLAMSSRDHLYTILQKVRFVRSNMIHCILQIDSKISFLLLNKAPHQKLSAIFSQCLKSIKDCPQDVDKFRTSVHSGLKELLRYYLWQIQQLNRFPEDLIIEKHAQRNTKTVLVREVLHDLRLFCKCKSTDEEMDLTHVMEQINDASVIAHVMTLLQINGNKTKFPQIKQNLVALLDTNLTALISDVNEKNRHMKSSLLENVRKEVEKFPNDILDNLDNEKLYRMKSIRDIPSVGMPQKEVLQHACKTM